MNGAEQDDSILDRMTDAVLVEDVDECNAIWQKLSDSQRSRYVDQLFSNCKWAVHDCLHGQVMILLDQMKQLWGDSYLALDIIEIQDLMRAMPRK